jgi:hypothetical protein
MLTFTLDFIEKRSNNEHGYTLDGDRIIFSC